ncbi:NADPH-dependent FMN reductase [Planococcus sp. YIM B11945]|uniref:NADPH-dependent FMN reductase n=1 Tax=Planococcus sp. YIM B11945 TaxID=3435410 RepID=UPI003D7D1E86
MAIKVTAIIGSVRKDSNNLKLVEYMKKRYADKLDIEPLLINELPMYNPDIEESPPQEVVDFRNKIKNADAVLFAVAEYNFSIPGSLKNAIDWLSRGGFVLRDKPAFIVGSSMGVLGSVRAQIHLREILSNPSLSPFLLPNNEVYIGSIHEKLNADNEMIDSGTRGFMDQVVDNFVSFYDRMTK